MRVIRIRHLTLAVKDIDAARSAFETLFGGEALSSVDDVDAFGARTQRLALGDSVLELASPTERDGALQRFLERRGEGVYTVAVEVDDLDAAVAELVGRGVRVSEPVEAPPGVRSAFVTMTATHGMSVQLVEAANGEGATSGEEPIPATGGVPAEAGGLRSEAGEGGATPEQTATEEPASEGTSEKPLLDLTPDEWSDTD